MRRLRSRAALLALAGTIGAAAHASRGCAPARGSDAALARALGEAAGVVVVPEEMAWEPSRGALGDAGTGRWILFLGRRPGPGELRDLWRARVEVSPEGRPLRVAATYDLTDTPLGDEHGLVVQGRRAAFVTGVYGRDLSVSVLDLAGEGGENKATDLAERAMACVTNVQRTGGCGGVGRIDVTLDHPARAIALAFAGDALAIEVTEDDEAHPGGARAVRATLDLASASLEGAPAGMHAQAALHLPKRLTHWAVDTVRAVPWIGPAPIAWLEDNVFALKDRAKRAWFKAKGGADAELAGDAAAVRDRAPALDTSEASVENAHWPPPTIPAFWKTTKPGEGEWVEPDVPWIQKLPGAPPPLLRTFVRPDADRPYATVILVAMDTRQLDLGMEGGTEDPRPLTGPCGTGRVPRDPAVYRRILAAYNGGFKTEHGTFGMMVNKRELLPPQPGAASVITLADGRVGMGSWGKGRGYDGIQDVDAGEVVSMRQNLDALLDRGVINPSGRYLWGYAAPGKGAQTERSGMCVMSSGHLVYAWSDDASAETLARAMKMAGCEYGMHLDMNGAHAGFLFTHIEDIDAKKYETELLSPIMGIPKDRYIQPAPKDFFYAVLRDPTPPPLEGGEAWTPDGGAQPAPSWMPSVWSARTKVDDVELELLDVEPSRTAWRIRAGIDDATLVSPARELAPEDAKRAVLAVGMGFAPEKAPRGLATSGKLFVPVQSKDWGVLVAQPDGPLVIVSAADVVAPGPGVDLAELPMLMDENGPRPNSTSARSALGTTPEGRVVVARGPAATPASLAEALARAGCTRAVVLDRGNAPPPLVHRAGLATPPLARYDETVLYAVARPMAPRGFRFEAAEAAPKKPPSWAWPF